MVDASLKIRATHIHSTGQEQKRRGECDQRSSRRAKTAARSGLSTKTGAAV
jgi:glyceraldehyde-3-phosphate dehydrogenase/erythrose-4-phosphate dehydrogenase